MPPTKYHDPFDGRNYLVYELKKGDVSRTCDHCSRFEFDDCVDFTDRMGKDASCNSNREQFQVFIFDKPGAHEEFHAKLVLRRLEKT